MASLSTYRWYSTIFSYVQFRLLSTALLFTASTNDLTNMSILWLPILTPLIILASAYCSREWYSLLISCLNSYLRYILFIYFKLFSFYSSITGRIKDMQCLILNRLLKNYFSLLVWLLLFSLKHSSKYWSEESGFPSLSAIWSAKSRKIQNSLV